jgi:hypothetical protein
MRKAFNALISKHRKIRYLRSEQMAEYFQPKSREAFTEYNGKKTDWHTTTKAFDIKLLDGMVKAVQFGNSVPDSERVYCALNLAESILILRKYFTFDFASIGFAYGARGRAGSIAHYQDSAKVLAFNRHWDGALIHELGHAIDYHLGRLVGYSTISRCMPYEIRSAYGAKLRKIENLSSKRRAYYMKPTEIFARMFEVYCEANIPELTPFMLSVFDRATLPDMDETTTEWLNETMKVVLK